MSEEILVSTRRLSSTDRYIAVQFEISYSCGEYKEKVNTMLCVKSTGFSFVINPVRGETAVLSKDREKYTVADLHVQDYFLIII